MMIASGTTLFANAPTTVSERPRYSLRPVAAHTKNKNIRFLLASRPYTIHIGVSPRKLSAGSPVVLFRLIIVIFDELRITFTTFCIITIYNT